MGGFQRFSPGVSRNMLELDTSAGCCHSLGGEWRWKQWALRNT